MPVSDVARRILATTLLLAFTAPAYSSIVHVGHREPAPLTTFGVNVDVRKGLRSVIPEGWQIFVHRSLTLPATLSWSPGQPWDSTLETFAATHGFDVKIDWTERAVYFRPSDVARAERGTAQDASPAAAASATASANHAKPAPEPPRLASAAAFNKATLSDVLARVAAAHGYTVSFDASDVSFAGALTVLGVDLVEDLQLVQRALGGERTPVSFQVFRGNRVVRVFDRRDDAALLAVVDDSVPASGMPAKPHAHPAAATVVPTTALQASAASAPAPRPQPQPQAPVVETVAAPVAISAPPRASAAVSFLAPEGEPLSASMRQFFEAQGWKLSWKADDDFVPEYPVSVQGDSLPDVLRKLKLPRFGLAVDLWTKDRVAVVRAFDPAQDH